jgi:hypothetical protein
VSKIGEPSLVAILAAAGVRELLVMRDVATIAHVERAAFFAARSQRAMCRCRRLGRERPSPFARRLRPRAVTRGSLTPHVSDVSVLSALSMWVVCTRRPRQLPEPRLAHVPPANQSRHHPDEREHPCRSLLRRGHHATELGAVLGAGKARRFAPTTRVVRAWPSGLDVACAQLTGSNCVMASLVLRLIFRRLSCQEIARTCVL